MLVNYLYSALLIMSLNRLPKLTHNYIKERKTIFLSSWILKNGKNLHCLTYRSAGQIFTSGFIFQAKIIKMM